MNAAEFNALYEVGVPVFAYPGCRPEDMPNDRRLVTRTRSKASVLGGHTDVVWVDDHSACIALSHIDVVSEDEWKAAKTAEAEEERARLRAELDAYEVMNPQQCAAGKHADWLVDSEHTHTCPWCRIAELETALTATGRSLSSFIFDSDDPGTDALGAQWLYHQAMPHADDPFAQPRAFRSSVFSEAATEVEKLDAQTPDDRRDHSQAYLDGYSDGLLDAAERLEKLADQAAEGTETTR